jgi:hypothetical protein
MSGGTRMALNQQLIMHQEHHARWAYQQKADLRETKFLCLFG